MTTEPRTIGLPDGREVVVIHAHYTYPEFDTPLGVLDLVPLPPPGTVVVGRLDNAPAQLADRITACKVRVTCRDHGGNLISPREYALPMSLDGLEWAIGHLTAALVAAVVDATPRHTVKEHSA